MKDIVLICQYGASTGLLVKKMLEEADKRNLSVNINAYSEYQIEDVLKSGTVGVVLMGPQIRMKKKEFEEKYKAYDVEFVLINPADYGMMNGQRVLDQALQHMKEE